MYMSRQARIIIPGIPHHITQRGNRRLPLFFTDQDRVNFLDSLAESASKWNLAILAYCLMTNHIHLQAIPETEEAFHRVLKSVFTRHAMRLNKAHAWCGHVVQNRFFSSPLDSQHSIFAFSYIEDNPRRAGMVEASTEYRWSSAYARARGLADPLIDIHHPLYQRLIAAQANGMRLDLLGSDMLLKFRKLHYGNFPIGSPEFVSTLEKSTGLVLHPRASGRPKKCNEK